MVAKQKAGAGIRDFMTRYSTLLLRKRMLPETGGLLPVQRRVMLAAHKQGFKPGRSRKCAALVGATLGLYHPHGDVATYGALVRMTGARYPLLIGHGNFGTLEDPPAAMRYTEVSVSAFGAEHLRDMDVVPTGRNYDGTQPEAVSLNAWLPLALLNGSQGIGSGFSVCIPPHNMQEIVGCLQALLENPEVTVGELVGSGTLRGPDYPEGGRLLSSKSDLIQLYETGTGTLKYGSDYTFRTVGGVVQITVTSKAPELRYNSLKSKLDQLMEAGLITDHYSVHVNSPSDPTFEYVVAGKDAETLEREVLPLLTSSVKYSLSMLLHHTKGRHYEGSAPILETGLLPLLRSFLNYRTFLTKHTLSRELSKKRAMYKQLQALRYAVMFSKELLKIITDPQWGSKTELVAAVEARTPLDLQQVEYLCALPIHRLSRVSDDDAAAQMATIKEETRELRAQLKNPRSILSAEFSRLVEKYGDERRTKVGKPRAGRPRKSAARSLYVVSGPDGRVRVLKAPPSASQLPNRKMCSAADALIAKTSSMYGLVSAFGRVVQHSVDVPEHAPRWGWERTTAVVGGVGTLVAIGPGGCYTALPFPYKNNTYQLQHDVVFAVVVQSGNLAVEFLLESEPDHKRIVAIAVDQLKVSTRPAKGKNLPGRPRTKKLHLGSIFYIPEGTVLREVGGDLMTLLNEQFVPRETELAAFSSKTVIFTGDKVVVGSWSSTAEYFDAGCVVASWAL